jgi:ATP-dependent DNA ligase
MKLELKPPIPPMEALSVHVIPQGPRWQYEPKWDGFRCLLFRDGGSVYLQSKGEKPLGRYFPEIVEAAKKLKAKHFVLDGEIAVPVGGKFDFDQLLQRIHPAASRIAKLSSERPALLIVFDILADSRGRSVMKLPLRERRKRLNAFD